MDDNERLVAIGMAVFHRVATAIHLYEDITPHAGRVPFSELPDVDRAWWHQQAQRMIDTGAIDLTTHRPFAVAGAQEHEHDWQPAGFTPHPASGGLMPTDQCRVCGAVRYPYSPDVQP